MRSLIAVAVSVLTLATSTVALADSSAPVTPATQLVWQKVQVDQPLTSHDRKVLAGWGTFLAAGGAWMAGSITSGLIAGTTAAGLTLGGLLAGGVLLLGVAAGVYCVYLGGKMLYYAVKGHAPVEELHATIVMSGNNSGRDAQTSGAAGAPATSSSGAVGTTR